MFGYGWQISIPYVQRLNKTGSENLFSSDDYFYSSLSGELVQIGSSNQYRSKIETGDFLTYELASDVWTVTDKEGTEFTFGFAATERQDNPSDSTEIYKWMLSEERDTNDNFIEYSYDKDQGQIYPDTITYTGHGSTTGEFTVEFFRESRPVFLSYEAGFGATTSERVNEIRVSVDGTWVAKHNVSYTDGDNGDRSTLTGIEHVGRTEAGTNQVTVTPFTGTYSTREDLDWSHDTTYDQTFIHEDAVRYGDVNGDGRDDILVHNYVYQTGVTNKAIYLNTETGWQSVTATGLPSPFFHFESTQNSPLDEIRVISIVDFDGDGYDDIYSQEEGKVFINQGDLTWSEDASYAYSPYEVGSARVGDVNGDGLPDLVDHAQITTSVWRSAVKINTGSGWSTGSWTLPEDNNIRFWYDNPSLGDTITGAQLLDANADGLADIMTAAGKVWLNTGDTWVEDPQWGALALTTGFRMGDLNDDGYVDIAVNSVEYSPTVWTKSVWLGTGNGWLSVSGTNLPDEVPFFSQAPSSSGGRKGYAAGLPDFDGDGVADLHNPESGEVFENFASTSDNLITIENRFGGTQTITYQRANQYTDGTNFLSTELAQNVETVQAIAFDSDFGNTFEETYEYGGGDYYFSASDFRDRQFAGFATVTKSTDLGQETTYFHQHNGNATATDEAGDSEARIGFAFRQDITDTADNDYTVTVYDFDDVSLGDGATFVQTESQLTLDYDGDTDHKDLAESYEYDDTTGAITKVTQWGEVSGSLDGTFTDSGSDKRTIELTYATNTDGVVALTSELVKDNAGTKARESKFTYDNLTFGSVGDGDLTKREDWITGSSYAETEWAYDAKGLVTSETDPRNKVTSYTYDSFDLYPATTTNAESHVTTATYDYSSGQLLEQTDPDGRVFSMMYDGLDRLLTESIPDPSTGSAVEKTALSYTDTSGAVSVERTDRLDGSVAQTSYEYVDGFGRTVQTRVRSEDTNQYVVRDFAYGLGGHLEKESLPYFDTGTAKSTATTDNDLYTEFAYDPLTRVVAATTTVGTTLTAYDQWIETVTDVMGVDKDFTYDAFGRLVEVTEHDDGSTHDTTYDWDANDNLIKITDALGNVRNVAYDGLSRRTSLEDLHDPADSTFGEWTFTYDDAGNLTSREDPEEQTVTFTYDDINRVLTEDYTGDTGTEVTYSYDTCTRGEGQLCSVSNGSATTSYTYDFAGNIETETRTIASTDYVTEYAYDRQANQTLITYPDDSEVRYTYNAGNQIEQVEQRENGGSFADIITDFDYGPHGLVTYQLHGNGASTTRTYDEDELYRLRTLVTTSTSTFGVGGGGPELAEYEMTLPLANATEPIEEPVSEPAEVTEPLEEDLASVEPEIVEAAPEAPESVTPSSSPAVIEAEVATDTEPIAEVIEEAASSRPVADQSTSTDPIVSATPTTSISSNSTQISNTVSELSKDLAIERRAEMVSAQKADNLIFETHQDRYELQQLKDKKDKKVKVIAKSNKPEIRLQKWNGEIDFGITYDDQDFVGANAKMHGNNLIRWQAASSKEEVHAYPLKAQADMVDGGFEIEIVLSEKPNKNTFDFKIDGHEDLDFFYQPELTSEQIAEGAYRPENVTGSYAVYHKEKKNHVLGETNYATGKAFHIYRPKISDAAGKEVWGELDYSKGKLTVVVPEDFLDTATYPVVVDPTFGYTTAGASYTLAGTNEFYAVSYSSPSDYGSFTSMSIYCDTSSGSANIKSGIYSSGTLVSDSVGSPVACTSAAGWKSPSYSTTPTLNPSTGYIFGAFTFGGNARMYYDWQSPYLGRKDNSNNYSNPDQNLGSVNVLGDRFSIYVTYAEAVNASPTAPTDLEAEGQTNPTDISDNTPEFTAIYADPDSGDQAVSYQLQVDDASDFSSPIWDSGKTALATTTEGNRIAAIEYAGSALASSTDYYWRIKFWDDEDAEGSWSTSTATFDLADAAGSGGGYAQISYVGDTLTHYSSRNGGTGITIDVPSGVEDGDFLIMFSHRNDNIGDFNTPSGWTRQTAIDGVASPGQDRSTGIFTRVADSEPANYLLTHTDGGNEQWSGVILAYRGVDQTTPLDVTPAGSHYREVNNSSAPSQAPITTVTDGAWVLALSAITHDDITTGNPPTGYTMRVDHTGGAIDHRQIQVADKEVATAGLESPSNWQNSVNNSVAESNTATMALRPAATSTGGGSGSSTPEFPIFSGLIQDLTYTYDAAGNITQIVDASQTDTAATTTYGYDDLNRLTSAATSLASTSPFSRTYTYDALGNILTKSDQSGSYSYDGDLGVSMANPHAVTAIGSLTFTYDDNGNLLTDSDGLTNTWDYENRLSRSVENSVTVDYEYDHTGQRVSKDNGTTTTIFASSLYEEEGTSTVKHVYAGQMLVATIEEDTPDPSIYHNHLDHLESTGVVTDEWGYVHHLLSYYPFGDPRHDIQYGDLTQSKRFTGHEYDDETALSYMGARYYSGGTGRFTAQDPVSLALGDWLSVEEKTGGNLNFYLRNPQTHNAYSYTANNPLKYVDKNGEFLQVLGIAAVGAVGAQYAYDVYSNVQSDGLSSRAFTDVSSIETYGVRAAQGAVVAGTGVLAASAGAVTAVQLGIVGLASSVAGAAGDGILGENVTGQSVVIDGAMGMLTFGAVKANPPVLENTADQISRAATEFGLETVSGFTGVIMNDLSEMPSVIYRPFKSNEERSDLD